jgi:hypothetical protein
MSAAKRIRQRDRFYRTDIARTDRRARKRKEAFARWLEKAKVDLEKRRQQSVEVRP